MKTITITNDCWNIMELILRKAGTNKWFKHRDLVPYIEKNNCMSHLLVLRRRGFVKYVKGKYIVEDKNKERWDRFVLSSEYSGGKWKGLGENRYNVEDWNE